MPVIGAVSVPARGLVVLHDFTRFRAYDRTGPVWTTAELSFLSCYGEMLKITDTTRDEIRGLAWDESRTAEVPFAVDLTTGAVRSGVSPAIE